MPMLTASLQPIRAARRNRLEPPATAEPLPLIQVLLPHLRVRRGCAGLLDLRLPPTCLVKCRTVLDSLTATLTNALQTAAESSTVDDSRPTMLQVMSCQVLAEPGSCRDRGSKSACVQSMVTMTFTVAGDLEASPSRTQWLPLLENIASIWRAGRSYCFYSPRITAVVASGGVRLQAIADATIVALRLLAADLRPLI